MSSANDTVRFVIAGAPATDEPAGLSDLFVDHDALTSMRLRVDC